MKHNHRRPPLPEWYSSCEPGICRWCGCCIVCQDDRPRFRLRWHPACAEEFKFMFWPDHARFQLLKKRGETCQDCGTIISYRKQLVKDGMGKLIPAEVGRTRWKCTEVAELHHIIPLASYPHDPHDPYAAWREQNCVLLCHACHVGPTGRHARLRQAADPQGRLFNL